MRLPKKRKKKCKVLFHKTFGNKLHSRHLSGFSETSPCLMAEGRVSWLPGGAAGPEIFQTQFVIQ